MNDKIKDLQLKINKAEFGKVKIGGKSYSTVPLRMELFRSNMSAEDILPLTNVFTRVDITDDKVISRAYLAEEIDVIINEDGFECVSMKNVKATGTAEELRTAHNINKTSAVENGETSALGRLIGNLGVHGGQMASANEVVDAVETGKVIHLITADKLLDRMNACKSKPEVNGLLKEHKVFLEDLKSDSEEKHSEIVKEIKEIRNNLPDIVA
tara:strand:- start:3485 stop:4120 length:636 start_codon:yes stop_codon:yes gene_type:complete